MAPVQELAASDAHYEEARRRVEDAYGLLYHAVENSAPLPNDVLVAVTAARDSLKTRHDFKDFEEETRFLNAYSLLFSNKLADKARLKYRLWLYVVLGFLLVGQIYYVAGSLIVDSLAQVEDEWQGTAPMSSTAPATAGPAPAASGAPATPPTPQAVWQTLRRFGTSQANYYLGVKLLPVFATVKVPDELIPRSTDPVKANFMANYMKLRSELQLILLSLSGYILPLLYGTLGAFAYIFRKLSDPLTKLNFAQDTWSIYTFRLHIGALGGLAIGWFINGSTPVSGAGALSPLALAFAAGYGSELLFTAMDKVVGAFVTPSGAQSSVKSETTQRGGLTISTETQRQAKVSGVNDAVHVPEPADPSAPATQDSLAARNAPAGSLRAVE
jgi:hypothetical protein